MFNSLNELKNELEPVLVKREEDMQILGFNKTKEDIWNELSLNKWKNSHGLTLNEMVDDVMKYLPRWDSEKHEKNN